MEVSKSNQIKNQKGKGIKRGFKKIGRNFGWGSTTFSGLKTIIFGKPKRV